MGSTAAERHPLGGSDHSIRSAIGTRQIYLVRAKGELKDGDVEMFANRYLIRPYFCSNPDSAITFSTAAMLRGTKSDVICAPDSVITIMSSSRM